MDIEKRFELIKRNTEEIVTEQELKDILIKKKTPTVYLGTAITGRPHAGYYVWVLKLADFLKAGFKVKVLLADLHGALDNCPWDVLEKRYKYYEKVISMIFESVGVNLKNIEFVKGSTFELDKKYFFDVLKMSTFATEHDCLKAASEVVKFGDNPKLAGLIYPIMQALDEEYLGVDIQYGGVDQRKIFMFARENLPKLGYKSRVEVMTPLIPGLIGKKMSASDEKSKIDLLDDEETVKKKINSAECVVGDIDNGILAFLKYVLMVVKKDSGGKFVVERPEKYGGNLEYNNYEQIEKDFLDKKLHPLDLKNSTAKEINDLLRLFRKNKIELQKLVKEAYT
ncbi:MAG: tyrosine--tRNA ligase [Candidatus Pacearchaeota archaeon]|nr:tyrosine--tRNA ligase [Candidatus Pacearchaeota archaeon]